MQIGKRSRTELKQYFVKNAIPTESNFAELIDGMLNQRDDGIVKPPNDALSLEATGDDTSQKRALQLYGSFNDPSPTWVLSLNPRQDPANAATARAGFSISDSAGNSRLFIDRGTGNVGVGTVGPRAALHIDRGATNDPALMLSSSGTGGGSGLRLENTAAGEARTFGIYAGSGALHFTDVTASTDRMLITQDGVEVPGGALIQEIGIGTQRYGQTTYPYETIQLPPARNFRIWFGTTEHSAFYTQGYFEVRGRGNEQAYIGGDGSDNAVRLGSTNGKIIKVHLYNPVAQRRMDLFCGGIECGFISHRGMQDISDARLKDNIEPVAGALDKVSRLRGVWFDWKDQAGDTARPRNLGLLAQEVREVVPEAVTEGSDGHLRISSSAVTVLLLEAVKEQQKQLDELRGALAQLRSQRKTEQ